MSDGRSGRRPAKSSRVWAYVAAAGAAVAFVASATPYALGLAARSLTVTMVEYVMLTEVIAPLAMFALVAGAISVPPAARALALRPPLRSLRRLWVAAGLEVIALVVLLLPSARAAATGSPPISALELCLVFLAALPLWSLAPHAEDIGAYGHVRVIAVLIGTALVTNVVGFFMIISTSPWYPGMTGVSDFGLTATSDQHTAGGVLIFVPDLIDFVTLSVLFIAWLNYEERKVEEAERSARN